jgi:hypothetical protein
VAAASDDGEYVFASTTNAKIYAWNLKEKSFYR